MNDGLSKKAGGSVFWAALGQFGSQGSHYLVLLLLAFLLKPSDFGLAGLAMAFILFSQAFSELGLAAAVVQSRSHSTAFLSTAFWSNGVAGVILVLATVASTGPLAAFLGDARVQPLLQALSLVFPITSVAVVPRALLQRDLRFKQLSAQQILSEAAFGGVGIAMAWGGWGVWSLVGAALAQRLVSTVALLVMARWRPGLSFSWECLKQQLDFGLPVMLASLLQRGIQNVDYFVVGRWLGAEALGYYTLAFQLAVVPSQRVLGVLRNVAFPAFSAVLELERVRKGFLEALRHLFSILAPLALLTAWLAPWFILSCYGQRWLPAVTPLQILTLAGFFYGFDLSEALFLALRRPQIQLFVTLARISLFLALVIFGGLSFGLEGVATSMALSVGLTSLGALLLAARLLGLGTRTMLLPVWPSLKAGAWACLPPLLLLVFTPSGVPPLVVFSGLAVAMSGIVLLSLSSSYRSLLRRMLPSRR